MISDSVPDPKLAAKVKEAFTDQAKRPHALVEAMLLFPERFRRFKTITTSFYDERKGKTRIVTWPTWKKIEAKAIRRGYRRRLRKRLPHQPIERRWPVLPVQRLTPDASPEEQP